MRKYLLPNGLPFFKANLHCHTTESDGHLTPEEIKSTYKAKGYSVIAFTDHEILVPHPQLNDPEFLALHGYELEVIDDFPLGSSYGHRKLCHLCLIALEPDNFKQVFWNRLYMNPQKVLQHRQFTQAYDDVPDTKHVFSGEGISDLMQSARNDGFFVTYNHPNWSLVDIADIADYHGMNALEIYNHGCMLGGYDDYNPAIYDSMLRRDQRVFCVAADDNHSLAGQFGGWNMICAEKLEYRTITKALENGHFYASTGPEIHALWFEDGNIHIHCSPASRIIATFGVRKRICINRTDAELTEAVIPVDRDDIYVRLTIWDDDHKHAETNGYFTDELFER